MQPTLHVGDHFAVDKVSRHWRDYQRGDVVVFRAPEACAQLAGQSFDGQVWVKRIVATEGDAVQVKHGALYVNGSLQDEHFVREVANYSFGPAKVPKGSVFVLGDNRNHSMDSHVWGFLPVERITGRACFKYWPLSRAGRLQTASNRHRRWVAVAAARSGVE